MNELSHLDMEQPRAVEMLAPALHRAERLPVVWNLRAGTIALVVLDGVWPDDDELRLALKLHTVLDRGVLALR
jgi:hypothetical protein